MSDLVERLRADQFMRPAPTKLELEAADEIEKLRTQVEILRGIVTTFRNINVALREAKGE